MSAELREITTIAELEVELPEDLPLSIDLHSQRLSLGDVRDISGTIRGRDIWCIDLSGTNLDDAGTQLLANAITASKRAQEVYLSNNAIGDEGAQAIARCIMSGRAISWYLDRNRIGAEGGEAIIRALARTEHSYSVDLSHNQLGDEGARRIALALSAKRGGISELKLAHNGIGIEGDRLLAQYLPQSVHVSYRTEIITASEYAERRPFLKFLSQIFFPVLLFLPFINVEDDKPGLISPRTDP